jgi:hypothetical protein
MPTEDCVIGWSLCLVVDFGVSTDSYFAKIDFFCLDLDYLGYESLLSVAIMRPAILDAPLLLSGVRPARQN